MQWSSFASVDFMLQISTFILQVLQVHNAASQQSVWWKLCQTTQCQFTVQILHICLETIRSSVHEVILRALSAKAASKDLIAQKGSMRNVGQFRSSVIRVPRLLLRRRDNKVSLEDEGVALLIFTSCSSSSGAKYAIYANICQSWSKGLQRRPLQGCSELVWLLTNLPGSLLISEFIIRSNVGFRSVSLWNLKIRGVLSAVLNLASFSLPELN